MYFFLLFLHSWWISGWKNVPSSCLFPHPDTVPYAENRTTWEVQECGKVSGNYPCICYFFIKYYLLGKWFLVRRGYPRVLLSSANRLALLEVTCSPLPSLSLFRPGYARDVPTLPRSTHTISIRFIPVDCVPDQHPFLNLKIRASPSHVGVVKKNLFHYIHIFSYYFRGTSLRRLTKCKVRRKLLLLNKWIIMLCHVSFHILRSSEQVWGREPSIKITPK